tara:strand:- start:351 stop:473 length:123 start_codon:yes stop_codon:yes gene_type:complete
MLIDTLKIKVDDTIKIVKQHVPKGMNGDDRVKINNFKELL